MYLADDNLLRVARNLVRTSGDPALGSLMLMPAGDRERTRATLSKLTPSELSTLVHVVNNAHDTEAFEQWAETVPADQILAATCLRMSQMTPRCSTSPTKCQTSYQHSTNSARRPLPPAPPPGKRPMDLWTRPFGTGPRLRDVGTARGPAHQRHAEPRSRGARFHRPPPLAGLAPTRPTGPIARSRFLGNEEPLAFPLAAAVARRRGRPLARWRAPAGRPRSQWSSLRSRLRLRRGLRPQYIQFGYHPQTSNRANAFATPTWLIPTRSAICR